MCEIKPIQIKSIKKEKTIIVPLSSSFPPVIKDKHLFKIHKTILIKKS
jgi:hypothetical protein